ncbi:MAG TPA: 6-phosphogluconolactonase [Verrucomicrobiae bacterium]|nr:6-phosphogluconolactonase [Verrucomicrobiae bacterium]
MALSLQIIRAPATIAGAAAKHFVSAIPMRSPWHVALSGGRIAKAFYEAIVAEVRSTSRYIDHVHFFFADERCVPPDSADSNFLTARQSLFDPLHIRAEQMHRIHGEVDDDYAAKEAEAELCRVAPLNNEGQPILDLVILGMGEDGHTASLFPGEPESLLNDTAVYRAVTAVKPPPRRITLGYSALRAARQLVVLVPGTGKEVILQAVLDQVSANNSQMPLARVLHGHNNAVIFTDVEVKR